MKKTLILIITAVVILVGSITGIVLVVSNDSPPTVTIEVKDKVYDGSAVDVNVLVSIDTTYNVFYKQQGMPDDSYTDIAPVVVGDYTVKVTASKKGENVELTKNFSITPKVLTVDESVFQDKVYDGTTDVVICGQLRLEGVVDGDDVALNQSNMQAYFSDANAEADKQVVLEGLEIQGEDSFNYVLELPDVTATIFKKQVTLSGISVQDKIYDGTNVAQIIGNPVLDEQEGLSFVGQLTATFSDSEVGNNIAIIFQGLTLTGKNAVNYLLVYPEITANILVAPTYNIEYVVNNSEMGYIEGESVQQVTHGHSATTVTAVANDGYQFVKWSDGVTTAQRTDDNVMSSLTVTAIFKAQTPSFDFANDLTDATIATSENVDANGYIQIAVDDSKEQCTILDKKIKLTTDEVWKLEVKFNISDWGRTSHFTFMGVSDNVDGINALQVTATQLRICALGVGKEIYYNLEFAQSGTQLETHKDYLFSLASDGSGNLTINIMQGSIVVVSNQVVNYTGDTNQTQVINCDVLENSFYEGGNMAHAGTIYYLYLTRDGLVDVPAERHYTINYFVNFSDRGTIEGQTTQTVLEGESASEVTAVPNSGYKFVKWSDGVTTASRTDTNVMQSMNITAMFMPIDSKQFDFVNQVTQSAIVSSENVDENGCVQMTSTDDVQQCTTLDEKLLLTTQQGWKLEVKFNISQWGAPTFFTLLGVSDDSDGINAIQVSPSQFRICALGVGVDRYYNLNFKNGFTQLEMGKDYVFTLTSSGDGILTISITLDGVSVVDNQQIDFTETMQINVVNCDVVGNSFFNGNNMGHSGTIYYLHVTKIDL